MADITLKNLGDIPVVEPNDSTHLLAEQDGAYARVPKDKVGVTSWNQLQDKPFDEEKVVIEWDGVIGDRAKFVQKDTETMFVAFVKVSDDIIPAECLIGGKVNRVGEDVQILTSDDVIESEDGIVVYGGPLFVANKPGATFVEGSTEIVLPETGTYFLTGKYAGTEVYTTKLEYTTIKQLDPKFIGGALSVVIEVKSGGVYTCDTPYADIVEALSAKKHVSIVLVDFNIGAGTVMQMYALKNLGLNTDGEIYMEFEQDYLVTFYPDGTLGETVFE